MFNKLENLKVLTLNECTSITGAKLTGIIEPLLNLEVLEIENLFKVANDVVQVIKNLAHLRKIELTGTKITEQI